MRDIFDDEVPGKNNNDFAKMFEASMGSMGSQLNVGDKIYAEILTIGKDEAFVSTGTIHDGAVLIKDLLDEDGKLMFKVGDHVKLYVTHVSGNDIRLSTEPTGKNISEDLEDAFDMMIAVEGRVTESIAAGFKVSVLGKNAFCPISQMDTKRVDKPDDYVGKKFDFLITQFEKNGKNIVLSRKKLLLESKAATESAFMEDKKVGDVISGIVTRLESYGAFIELNPGLEGLVHISEISWSRVSHPSDVLQMGQMVQVQILKMEDIDGKLKISLSIKQAQGEPWMSLPGTIQLGAEIKGKVTRCMKFGAFVEVAPGIEGLLPLSEMNSTKKLNHSSELFTVGDSITITVKELNLQDRKLTLSISKPAEDESWREHIPLQKSKNQFGSSLADQLAKLKGK